MKQIRFSLIGIRVILPAVYAILFNGCKSVEYTYREPLLELERRGATTSSVVETLGEPAKISRSLSAEDQEGPPIDLAYRYYFATSDGYVGAKIFYFFENEWVEENVLGGERREALFRLLDPKDSADSLLIKSFESANPNLW